ncbi:MAG: hypothetical protein WKF84_23200 [Pyrinomonadaceae bacterium]
MLTEFGGIAYRVGLKQTGNEWGYCRALSRLKTHCLRASTGSVKAHRCEQSDFVGYCYTQLTDVEQEINGLMTYDRKPKASRRRVCEDLAINVRRYERR